MGYSIFESLLPNVAVIDFSFILLERKKFPVTFCPGRQTVAVTRRKNATAVTELMPLWLFKHYGVLEFLSWPPAICLRLCGHGNGFK